MSLGGLVHASRLCWRSKSQHRLARHRLCGRNRCAHLLGAACGARNHCAGSSEPPVAVESAARACSEPPLALAIAPKSLLEVTGSVTLSSVPLHTVLHCSVHGYAQVHTSICIYIYNCEPVHIHARSPPPPFHEVHRRP